MGKTACIVRHVRAELRRGGSRAHSESLQRFFKEPVRAYGWRTAVLRKYGAVLRRQIAAVGGPELLFAVAEKLFRGATLEEHALAVILLEGAAHGFGDAEFRRLERWIGWIRHWGACDSLGTAVLGPMLAADQRRFARAFRWAKAKNRWHRRMAAVALIPAVRRGVLTGEALHLVDRLLCDRDDMVQKGVGWLLKELGEKEPRRQLSYLLRVRGRAPRLVLRIASEKLPRPTRRRILGG